MKTLNEYIVEDGLQEVCEIIDEVLSNNLTNEEIEESFDEFNLVLESLSENDIKRYIKAFINTDNGEHAANAEKN